MPETFTPMKAGENPRPGFDQTLSGTKLNARSAARRAKYRDVFFSNVRNIWGRCKAPPAIDYMDVRKPIPMFDSHLSINSPSFMTFTVVSHSPTSNIYCASVDTSFIAKTLLPHFFLLMCLANSI